MCQMLSMVGSLGESRGLLPPQPVSHRLGTAAAWVKNVLRFMMRFLSVPKFIFYLSIA